jgi:hypothetical protein
MTWHLQAASASASAAEAQRTVSTSATTEVADGFRDLICCKS